MTDQQYPAPDARVFPVTPMQTALLQEGTGTDRPWVNVEQVLVHFEGETVDEDVLRSAWQTVAARHDVLRLHLNWRAVPAVQTVLAEIALSLKVEDCPGVEIAQRAAQLERFLESDRVAGVDLPQTNGWRVSLLRYGPSDAVMVWTIHHALVDGRSMAIILADLLGVLDHNTLPAVSETPDGFGAFCRSVVQAQPHAAEARTFFAEYLAGFDDAGTLAFPTEVTESPNARRNTQQTIALSPELARALGEVAAGAGSTLANVMQAAWGIVNARWSGQSNVAFGAIRSGRHGVGDTGSVAGCFINALPMRINLTPLLTLGEVLQDLRRVTLAMHPFEQTSSSAIRQAAGIGGRQPLFSSVVMFERGTLQTLVRELAPAARLRQIDLIEEGGMPLTLGIYAEDAIRIVLEHDPGAVTDGQAQELLRDLRRLLDSIATAAPDTLVGDLDMMTTEARDDLLGLSRPDTPLSETGACLVRGFQQAVARNPDAIALETIGGDAPLTYAALDQRANGLAAALVAEGVGTGDVVGVGLPRSADFIVALIAILKTGAAFLPVDPTYSADLQAHMLQVGGVRVLIGVRAEGIDLDLRVIDPAQPPLGQSPDLPALDPEQRAYVLFTSGSTGKPKGVQVTRRNLLSHIAATRVAFALTPDDRALQFASLSFDGALEEIFPTLLTGATLVLRNDDIALSASAFLETSERLKLSIWNLPTAFWHVLTQHVSHSDAAVPDSLRLVIVGGEQANPHSLAAWRKAAPDVRWLNTYGPTEATIICTLYEPQGDLAGGDVPIGRPTAHARVYVLAPDGSLAPRGAVGDLAIGGRAVTQGYIGQPEQTAQVFLPDRFDGAGRIYLSGDRAQWRDDGNMAFLGRQDRQVKLRGFRVDLRQIERALEAEVPGLRTLASVLDRKTPAARLVAWVMGADIPDVAEIAGIAARVLPPHMQPALVAVDTFPRTAAGKIDIAALPRPETAESAEPDSAETEFRSALEADICAAMALTLGRAQVTPDQNYYEIGGNSLLAVELIGRIEALAGERLGLADFHSQPTPRHLAEVLLRGSTAPKHIIPIQPSGTRPPLIAVHILGANEEYFRPLAAYLGPDQPVMGLSVGSLDEDTPTGVEFTAGRYCEDINEFYPEGPINLMAVSLGSYMAFELARQLRASGRDVRMLAFFDAAGPDGREERTGLNRLMAHLRRARYIGIGFPAQIIHNRIHNLRNALATRQLQGPGNDGANQAPKTVFEFIASNELAVKEYTPGPIDVPLVIFRAESHFLDTKRAIRTGLGWKEVAQAGFQVIDVPGGHLSLLQEPNVSVVSGHIARLLARKQG